MEAFTRSQIQSILAIVVAVAAAVGDSLGAVNPKLAGIVALISALSAAVGRTLSKVTDNHAITIIGVVLAIVSVLSMATDFIPADYLPYLGIAATGLTAFGRSVWGDQFPGADKPEVK